MPKTRLISPGSIPNHKLLKNLQLQGKYISNDGGDEGISIDNDGETTISAALKIKELSATPSADGVDTFGHLWVLNQDPTQLYFTNDDGHDIQLTSGSEAIGTIALAADRITVGDAAVNIATSSGDIVFKSNNSSGTEEWLTFSTSDMTWGKFGNNQSNNLATEIHAKSGHDLVLTADGVGNDVILRSDDGSINLVVDSNGGNGNAIRYLTDTTPTPSANWEDAQTQVAIEQTSTSGSGVGATFNITTTLSGAKVAVYVGSGGKNYAASDTIVLTDPGNTSSTVTVTVESIGLGQILFSDGHYSKAAGWVEIDPNIVASGMGLYASNGNLLLGTNGTDNAAIKFEGRQVELSSSSTRGNLQGYTEVRLGDRAFVGNSACNQYRMRLDGTDANRIFQISATDVSSSDGLDATAWANAGGLTTTVSKTTGDALINGSGEIKFTPKVLGGSVEFEKEYTGTTGATSKLVIIDYDATGDTADTHVINNLALDINLHSNAQTAVGTVNNTGIDVDLTGGTSGTQNNIGIDIAVSGADTNYALITSGGNVGIGVSDPDHTLEILKASDQLKLSYDSNSYATFGVNSTSRLKITTAESGSIELDSQSTIDLDVGSNSWIDITDPGTPTNYVKIQPSAGLIQIYQGGVNYLKIDSDANAATTITTLDYSGAAGHFIMDIDGDITLDSATGNFIAKKAGTEFSAANSAYAGMILGYTAIGIDATKDSVQPAATFAVTDADHKVTFVAPPSGKVEVFVSISAITTTQRWIQFGLSDNATYAAIDFPNADDVTNEHNIIDLPADGYPRILTNNWVVEGLTAGTSYTWWLGAETEQAGRMTLHWGGATSGAYPPFIMKATALPATIYTG